MRVGIIGLGYVGLPLARAFAGGGSRSSDFDVDPEKVAKLDTGTELHRPHPRLSDPADARSSNSRPRRLSNRLAEPDAVIVCVPTPLTDAREPDLTYIVRSTEAIAATLRPGQLIVLESTTYPGTTRQSSCPSSPRRSDAGRTFFWPSAPSEKTRAIRISRRRRFPRWSAASTEPAWNWPCRFTAR